MSLLDSIKDTMVKFLPQKEEPLPKPGMGSLLHEEDMIVSKPTIVCHASEMFFSFLAMCCFASVASFQAQWAVGPSGLSVFAIFIALIGLFVSAFMLLVPVIYEKYDKLVRLARAMQEVRVGFILAGIGLSLTFLISFIVTISAWTEPGCKNPNNDPHASKGDNFKNGLSGWCTTKKAGAIFFWLSTIFWIGTMTILVLDWRSSGANPRRDPNFNPPAEMRAHEDDEDDDDESRYNHIPSNTSQLPPLRRTTAEEISSPFSDDHRYRPDMEAKSRPSIDAYGAFSDPAPTGFDPPPNSPGVSRTMQYADPYAAVRASIGTTPPQILPPPTYEYQGYR